MIYYILYYMYQYILIHIYIYIWYIYIYYMWIYIICIYIYIYIIMYTYICIYMCGACVFKCVGVCVLKTRHLFVYKSYLLQYIFGWFFEKYKFENLLKSIKGKNKTTMKINAKKLSTYN